MWRASSTSATLFAMIWPVVVLGMVVQAPAPVAKAQQAIAQDPKNPAFHLGKCRALASASRHNEAIPACTESLRLRPDDAEALRDRGHYYLNLGRVEPGLADLSRAANLAKTDRGAYYHLGVAYYLKGDFARAAAAY